MSAPEGKRSRSWFSIIMMVFLCILWSVPTLGLLISSFRPTDRLRLAAPQTQHQRSV